MKNQNNEQYPISEKEVKKEFSAICRKGIKITENYQKRLVALRKENSELLERLKNMKSV